eukprot:comp18503_c0_seq1/m.19884 comp18503_c0_seq1/g.19884  ORF comp18503_c0_seq1/g.19884 comp18503_c0_seq1/m.19884 type:complete len:419 (-) comp18503_c0_seq1:619-1875(-)
MKPLTDDFYQPSPSGVEPCNGAFISSLVPNNPEALKLKNASSSTATASLGAWASEHDTPSLDGAECPVCLSAVAGVSLPCGHSFCSSCVSSYVMHEISEGRTALACMECEEQLPMQLVVSLLDKEKHLVDRLEYFSVRSALLQDPDCRFCPYPDCGYAVIAGPTCREIKCERGCGSFCYDCRGPAHGGDCKEMVKKLSDMLDTYGYKRCPRCNVMVTKTGGCNAIMCTCGCEFCWVCGQPCSEVTHFLPHKPCRQFSAKPPLSAADRWLRYGLTVAAAPILIPAATISGAAMTIYLLNGAMREKVKRVPAHEKRKKIALTTMYTASAVVWAPLAGVVGATVTVVGATTYYLGFPVLLAKDNIQESMKKKKRVGVQPPPVTGVEANLEAVEMNAKAGRRDRVKGKRPSNNISKLENVSV